MTTPQASATPRPDLLPVLTAWGIFGKPAHLGGGGMTSPVVVDNRASLYQPRLAWLAEEGITGGEKRLYLEGWAALDATYAEVLQEMISEAQENN